MMPVAVLCGGLGTRMRPKTLTVPKVLLEVLGEPFLGHVLRRLAAQGVTDAVLLTGFLGEMIEAFAGDGSAWGLRLTYSGDGARPLGTAGAVRAALPLLGERFLMTFGDAYLPVDYRAVERAFLEAGTLGLMTLYRPQNGVPPNAAASGALVTRYEKRAAPSAQLDLVDYGLCGFRTEAFASLAVGEPCDLGAVNTVLIAQRQLAAYLVVDQPPHEIGTPEGLRATEAYLHA